MDNIAFIPARGGSKRLPKKNRLLLNGIPLVTYTIKAAKKSKIFKQIVVSTDDQYIVDIAQKEGVTVDHRQKELAGDRVTVVDVLKNYLSRKDSLQSFDTVAALYPTSPLRDEHDIIKAYKLFFNHPSLKSLISITEYDFPPQFSMSYEKESNTATMHHPDNFLKTQSQSQTTMFHPNGAIFISYLDSFLQKGTFYSKSMKAYLMDREKSIDIDNNLQFKFAEHLLKTKAEKNHETK